jgi:hypothetical protein
MGDGRRWALLMGALVPMTFVWALTNPMFASPDETAHMVRAQGFSHGDFVPPFRTDGIPIDSVNCFRFQAQVTAACQDLTWDERGTELDVPTEGYPPVFHALAAVPAMVLNDLAGAYAMRLWMALLCCGLLAWAGTIMTRPRRGAWPFAGWLVALSPMVIFMASSVNPSGLTAAFAAVLMAGVLAVWHYGEKNRSSVAALVIGAAGLATVRRDGVLWLGLVLLACAPLLPLGRLRAAFRRRRVIASATLAAVAALAVSVRWAIPTVDRFVSRREIDGDGSAWQGVGQFTTYLRQLTGVFGWLDTPLTETLFLVAVAVAGLVLLLSLAAGASRLVLVTLLASVILLLAPVAFGAVRFPYLQGRYLFPIWICLYFAAGAAITPDAVSARVTARLMRIVAVAWLVVHVGGLLVNLRRYAVGETGPLWFFFDRSPWRPPPMSNGVAVVLIAVAASIVALAGRRLVRELERSP